MKISQGPLVNTTYKFRNQELTARQLIDQVDWSQAGSKDSFQVSVETKQLRPMTAGEQRIMRGALGAGVAVQCSPLILAASALGVVVNGFDGALLGAGLGAATSLLAGIGVACLVNPASLNMDDRLDGILVREGDLALVKSADLRSHFVGELR